MNTITLSPGETLNNISLPGLLSQIVISDAWAPEPVPQVPQPRDQCCEGLMNFIISERGSADSAIIQSVNLNMLRVREQDAARGWVLMEMYTKQFSAAQLHNYLVSKNGCE